MSDGALPLGVLLAGGLARRMGGGDKGRREVGGIAILDRVMSRVRPQVAELIINANGAPERFASTRLAVVADTVPDFAGPLAGILAALEWSASRRPDIDTVVSVPTDSPFLPHDLVERLQVARRNAGKPIACAASGGQTHPVVGLWPVRLRGDLRRALTVDDERKIDRWTARHGVAVAEWPDEPFDPFFNVNTPEDIEAANGIADRFGHA